MPGADIVVTPLRWQEWQRELSEHPDREWVSFLVRGICHGFRLGHDQSRVTVRERRGTMYEASQHREIISDYLKAEERAERIWKVTQDRGAELVQCSPFGVIPKKGKPGNGVL